MLGLVVLMYRKYTQIKCPWECPCGQSYGQNGQLSVSPSTNVRGASKCLKYMKKTLRTFTDRTFARPSNGLTDTSPRLLRRGRVRSEGWSRNSLSKKKIKPAFRGDYER